MAERVSNRAVFALPAFMGTPGQASEDQFTGTPGEEDEDDEEQEEDAEQDLGDAPRPGGYSCKAQGSGHEGDHEKDQSPLQHACALSDTVQLAHRADPEGRVSEKWIRFSAFNDALIIKESIGPKSANPLLGPML